MTVYILHVTWATNRELAGVFSSPEKAEESKKKHPASNWSNIAEYDPIEVCEIDAGLSDEN